MSKILLSVFFIGASHFMIEHWQTAHVESVEMQSEIEPSSLPCVCTPDYAGEDKVTCKQIPAQSVQIGCTLDGANPLCSDLCFLWSPAAGLNPADNMKSDPMVNPTVTTTYTVIVKDSKLPAPGIVGTFEVVVYVIEMQLILYKPKVIATNTTTPASLEAGAQTFVNFDNDDNDVYYDNAKFEPTTGGVTGGDDELVRAELILTPIDLPDKMVRLVATQGAADIKVWTDETKSGAEYLLNTDIELSLDGTHLKKDLWIEGRAAHSVQKGTKLKMTYKGEDCETNVSITILGVENISWIGNGNSVSNSNGLDVDPNYLPPSPSPATWPSAVRVFPDARAPAYTVPLNTVQLEVTLSVTPVENVDMYVRSFDVDDPTNNSNGGLPGPPDPNFLQFLDPNDDPGSPLVGSYAGTGNSLTFTQHEDNRSADPKAGAFAGQIGNSAPISFTTASATRTITFPNISMHPGDNYRAVVNGDKDFLENLENLDERDEHKIVDKFVIGTGSSPTEILIPLKYGSPVLTIWRFLHFEGDSMEGPGNDGFNQLIEVFSDFTPNGSILNLISSGGNIARNWDDGSDNILDPSAITTDPVPCTGAGRFQDGNVRVINGAAGILPGVGILTNTETSIELAGPLDLTGALCTFNRIDPATGVVYNGTASLSASPTKINNPAGGSFYTWPLNNVVLTPGWATLLDFVGGGGTFKINSANNVPIDGATIAPQTLRTSGFSLRTRLDDDDVLPSVILPRYPLITGLSSYESSYLKVQDIGSISATFALFDPNINDAANDIGQVTACNQSIINENDAFWCAHLINSFQGATYLDFDGEVLTPGTTPPCPPIGSVTGIESSPLSGLTPSAIHNTDLVLGGDESFVFLEVLREFPLAVEAQTVGHEIGHQFGLSHGDADSPPGVAIPECCGPTMGLMSKSGVYYNLIPRHQNLIRSRVKSPGH
ncbi:MAG: hypothetical protein ACKVT2_11205 [Saprospiraceae bacterium]